MSPDLDIFLFVTGVEVLGWDGGLCVYCIQTRQLFLARDGTVTGSDLGSAWRWFTDASPISKVVMVWGFFMR